MEASQQQLEGVSAQLHLITSTNDAKKTLDGLEILLKLLQNIVKNPLEDKFRQIKGTIPKIASTLFALSGVKQLLSLMNFTEIETNVFVYLDSDVHYIARNIHIVEDALLPIRMQFMTPEEKEK